MGKLDGFCICTSGGDLNKVGLEADQFRDSSNFLLCLLSIPVHLISILQALLYFSNKIENCTTRVSLYWVKTKPLSSYAKMRKKIRRVCLMVEWVGVNHLLTERLNYSIQLKYQRSAWTSDEKSLMPLVMLKSTSNWS